MARIPIVQKAWKEGQELRIHGLVYQLENGLLKDLSLTLSKADQLPEEYRIYWSSKDYGRNDLLIYSLINAKILI